ncbi:Hypothetical predicted protein [Podarcis lilfordi]|uniref:Uncharacterized protein n=1 Tax=Podarcis lilfordi TaxID=74358 RepID=A0AA35JY40_9SAUR|nr:Hypothetical predicted protein [Podarcis lilfordi]
MVHECHKMDMCYGCCNMVWAPLNFFAFFMVYGFFSEMFSLSSKRGLQLIYFIAALRWHSLFCRCRFQCSQLLQSLQAYFTDQTKLPLEKHDLFKTASCNTRPPRAPVK